MRYIKSYKKFNEDVDCSTTSGMGSVISSQPGSLPGESGMVGSGDIGFTFKKGKGKKGNPSQVTDMNDLEPAKGVKKVNDLRQRG